MPTLPTLTELYNTDRANLEAEFGVNISLLKKVALRVLAAVHSGKMWLLYKVLAFVLRNVWPDTADPESKGGTLERFGRVKLGRNPKAAVAGQYDVTVTGSNGATIPAQTTFKSNDDSRSPTLIYILDNAHVMVGTSDTITLRALTTGTDAKLDIGDKLTSVSPIANVDSGVVVTAETVQPLAAETTEAYRSVLVSSFRLEATGGSPADYILWSLDAQGVAKVYAYFKNAVVNGVDVFVEATEADSSDGKGTPTPAILADVEAVINYNPDTSLSIYERGRKPTNDIPYVQAIMINNVDIEITGSNFTPSQETLITNALTAYIKTIRPFVAAADVIANKNDIIDTNKINGVIFAQVPGAVYTGVVLKVNAVAVLTYTFTGGNIPWTNSVTFP